jgi:hypothetical protein
MKIKKIPKILANYWSSVQDEFSYYHYHFFCWVLIAHCIHPGKATLAALCRWIPEKILYKHLVRLLQSDRWNFMRIFRWHCNQVWKTIPPPQDGILYLLIDKTLVEKTGKKHPYNHKTKTGYGEKNWKFGFYVVILVAHWGSYRFPIDFRLVTPKETPGHKTPNQLFVEMFEAFAPQKWTRKVICLADCEYAAKASIRAIVQRGQQAHITGVEYFFVFSFSRTWKFDGETTDEGKPLKIKDFINQLSRYDYQKTWFMQPNGRRKYFWTYTRQACLDGAGDVTMVISKKGRNISPKKAKILVTNIPNATAQDVVKIYRKRWYIEVLNHELKSACGLGDHQVTKKPERVERSVAISMIAYLTMLRFEADKIRPNEHWSMNTLKHFFTIRVFKEQSESQNRLPRRRNTG